LSNYQHLQRWYRHIASFKDTSLTMTTDTQSVDLPVKLLQILDQGGEFNSSELSSKLNIDHQLIVGAINSILAHEGVITTKIKQTKVYDLTEEGKEISETGSHEHKLLQLIGPDGLAQTEALGHSFGKIGVSKALEKRWISLDKKANPILLKRIVDSVTDEVQDQLKTILKGELLDGDSIKKLKGRKLIIEKTINAFVVSKGPSFTLKLDKPEVELTADMLASGEWKTKPFKQYNFNAQGIQPSSGCLHPLLKVRAEFRDIFFQMGFSEMPTNHFVESSFWNFDALFQPQQHPARDAHDTFFLSDPAISTEFPMDYLGKVKTVHSKGGFGSIGYGYNWKIEEAQKNVLRTHTTAVSARQLYLLAKNGYRSSKMFSIDRVFRNENLDATHLAEFHQVEGVIAERNLSLGHVIGLFTEFFRKCGIENLRFKHTYNPYTEPSMEIYAYHDKLAKWVEIGNSGLFRPEMLLPMGLPADVNVAGFGLSLERPTMIRYDIRDIRKLFGHKTDLAAYRTSICRLEKY